MVSRVQKILNLNWGFYSPARNKHVALCSGMAHVKVHCRQCSTEQLPQKDLTSLFVDERVQSTLKKLTGMNYEKVFRKRKLEQKLVTPKYVFMTEDQLEAELKEAHAKAKKKLQMPPVVNERQPINEVLANDSELIGYDTSKFVFTDITYGIPDRKRVIVVRDPDGTLRKASWEERDKMNQIYFPKPGRKLMMPSMFQDGNLQEVLDREEYEFILDRACSQFEADDPNYIRVTRTTYDHIDSRSRYDTLDSTRHYGPMVFCLVMKKNIDNFIIHLIHSNRLEDAADSITLFCILHKDTQTARLITKDMTPVDILKNFIINDSVKKSSLELALQAYEDIQKQKEELQEGIRKAHGQA